MINILSLHKHWMTADCIKQFAESEVPPEPELLDLPEGAIKSAQLFLRIQRFEVFCALLYVVIDGYKKLGCQNFRVDALLARADRVKSLYDFRNAVFHYHKDPFSQKLIEFLTAANSESWIQEVHEAFQKYFEEALPMQTAFKTLGEYRESKGLKKGRGASS